MINEKGYIHSIETLGTLDGPGLRTVVFFQGCPLRCKFCHNVDSTLEKKGKQYTVEELMEKVMKNKEYWGGDREDQQSTGGVTISGGEPVLQPEFLKAFLEELKKEQVHIVVDTCLYTRKEVIAAVSDLVDYWMVSLKHMDTQVHLELTGVPNTKILENIQYLDDKLDGKKALRIRFLVIPGLTDKKEHIEQIAEFVSKLESLDVMELLPYGEHGKHKWVELFGKYPLEGKTREADKEDLDKVAEILKMHKIKLRY